MTAPVDIFEPAPVSGVGVGWPAPATGAPQDDASGGGPRPATQG